MPHFLKSLSVDTKISQIETFQHGSEYEKAGILYCSTLVTQKIFPLTESAEHQVKRVFTIHTDYISISCPCLLDVSVSLYFTQSHPLSEVLLWFFVVSTSGVLFRWLFLNPHFGVSTISLFCKPCALSALQS